MQIDFHPEPLIAKAKLELARRQYAAAVLLQTTLKAKLSTPYPPASQKGEYPHARTFYGRNDVWVLPSTPEGIVADGNRVYVGFSNMAWYMPFLERERGRLGIFHLYEEMKPQLAAILGGGK